MAEQNFTLLTTQTLNQDLGFAAFSAVVNNISGQWFYSPTAGIFIPPYVSGAVLSFLSGTQVAKLQPITPPGQLSTPKTGEQCIITFSSIAQAFSPGIALNYAPTANAPSNMIFAQGFLETGIGGATTQVVVMPGIATQAIRITAFEIYIRCLATAAIGGDTFAFIVDSLAGVLARFRLQYSQQPANFLAGETKYELANDTGLMQANTGADLIFGVLGGIPNLTTLGNYNLTGIYVKP